MAALGRLRVATGAEAETAAFPSSRHARLRLLLATSSDRLALFASDCCAAAGVSARL